MAADVGLGAAGGAIGAGVIEGAGLGALTSGITGGDPLKGALTGGLTGGAIGGAGAAGFGAVGQAAVGAGAGALSAELTGQNPLTGALTGGAGGAVAGSGLLSGGGQTGGTAVTPGSTTGGAVGAGSSAPVSITPPTGGLATDPTSAAGVSTASAAGATAGGAPVNSVFGGQSDYLSGSLLRSPDVVQPGFAATQTTSPQTPSVLSSITGGGAGDGLGGFISRNPGAALGAGALGITALMGNKPSAAENTLTQQAGEAASQARVLESYQQTGTLPPGLQAVVDRQQNNAVAGIKSRFAELGMSGSTAEAQQIASAHQESAITVAQIADNLAKQGINWQTLSSQDLENVIHAQQVRDTSFTQALGTFAAGLAGVKFNSGSGGGTTSNV